MERLTKVMYCDDGNKLYDYSNEVVREYKDFSSRLKLMFEKLAHYEDLEEQGLLVKLPCKVGDEVYYIFAGSCGQDWCNDECFGCEDSRLEIRVCPFCITMIDDIGKTVFLTKAEAEAKLKEMQNETYNGK